MIVSYNWLKEYLGENIPSPEELAELITFHAFEVDSIEEAENDTIIDIKVLPDRGSDCLSHRGIAREIASIINSPLEKDPLAVGVDLPKSDKFQISIENKDDCRRFTAVLITGVKVGPSPAWLQERLLTIGQRPINNIVDATNYVMYAVGQPLHAYDADLFASKDSKWHFSIRRAKVDEMISLLPEKPGAENREVKLTGKELLIVDGSSNTPIGLAGVKGGAYAGVHQGSTNIIIEAANFSPSLTRRTSRSLGIVIDASKRFENEPSRELPLYALKDITTLIEDIAGGKLQGICDEYPNPAVPKIVMVRLRKVNEMLGLKLSESEVEDIFKRIGAKFEKVVDGYQVTAPFERTDLEIEANYIDEIGRIYGLSKVQSVIPPKLPLTDFNKKQYYAEKVRQILLGEGFSEVITSSFRQKDEVKLQSSLASDKSYLRSDLAAMIDKCLMFNSQNLEVLGLSDIRIFEIGTVFKKGEGKVIENLNLCLGIQTKKTGRTEKDNKFLTEVIERLKQAGFNIEVSILNGVCEINFDDLISSLPNPTKYEPFTGKEVRSFRPFSVYPAVVRDIALWVDESVKGEDVSVVLRESAGPLVLRIDQFDQFAKEGRVSYAFRLVFQSMDKTLNDEEIQFFMDNVYKKVVEKGFEVR
jgi:phenylalanyl-tRNA synthetase beta chain